MKLLDEKLLKKFPSLQVAANTPDPVVICRLMHRDFSWCWYPVGFDGKDTFLGQVDTWCPEWGYFTLAKLTTGEHQWGIPLEVDPIFSPCTISEVRERRTLWPTRRGLRPKRRKAIY